MGRRSMHVRSYWEIHKERDREEDLDAGGRIILKWILEKCDRVVLTRLTCIRIGTSGGLL
jgi:hypothetical protein